jgi:hypothetical protein
LEDALKILLKSYGKFDIYVWTTGKFELYDGNTPIDHASTLAKLVEKHALEDMYDGSSMDMECGD